MNTNPDQIATWHPVNAKVSDFTSMYPEPIESSEIGDTCFLDLVRTMYAIHYRLLQLSKSGVDLDSLKDMGKEVMDIDVPNDPLDEEDPFNPYDFI